MSDGQEDVSSQPLVIVRRRRQTEEAHHGGVWKIAYADFMTAMMAFFLVMWLVNAADKKTIVQVAAYFNPMRLTDRTEVPKGLEDTNEMEVRQTRDQKDKTGAPHPGKDIPKGPSESSSKPSPNSAEGAKAQKASGEAGGKIEEARKEDALFDDPGTLLNSLADKAKADLLLEAESPPEAQARDPFDRTVQDKRSNAARRSAEDLNPGDPLPPQGAATVDSKAAVRPPSDSLRAAVPAPVETKPAPKPGAEAPGVKQRDPVKEQLAPGPADKAGLVDKESEAKKVAKDISSAISKVLHNLPNVEVKATSEGLLVSLLDDAKFGMFEVGSAKPRPELVIVMDKIGEVLKEKKGDIVVRGHTDDRAYRNGNYDNWRLSAARAQMAHHMLVRGGIAESRFVAIEGRADRDPKIPSDTSAAQNRRIEILIRERPR
ncbi:MotB family protein [Hyphomicrobium methylovorum]|uniref:MotB family protein n=1 Tax=Hyphomicrobium methylovorum TaxID=84 RepID=UPI0015E63E21|nr:MotB family protein [Hyphomicrobium methylovorum]MBA2125944.1 MotB family protein [Hyphomicrobium methylovorum]